MNTKHEPYKDILDIAFEKVDPKDLMVHQGSFGIRATGNIQPDGTVQDMQLLGVSMIAPEQAPDLTYRRMPKHLIFDISVIPTEFVLDEASRITLEEKIAALGISHDILTSDNTWSSTECIMAMMLEEQNSSVAELIPVMPLGAGIEGRIQKRSFDYELIGGL